MKRKFDFWLWMVKKEAFFVWIAFFLRGARELWGLRNWKWLRIGKMLMGKNKVVGGEIFVALNGPSVKRQPLEKVAGKMDVICVNQGFRLPQYKLLHPKFHVFIDSKLIHGVWDVKWLDEILEMVPDITFVMPAAWANLKMFRPYIERKVPIIWIKEKQSHGVSSAAFHLAWELGYRKIYFTGYEGTSFVSSLLKQSSHFYGADPDEDSMTSEDVMKSYYMNANHFRCAFRTCREAKRLGVHLINLTEGGVMNMFDRERFEDVFK